MRRFTFVTERQSMLPAGGLLRLSRTIKMARSKLPKTGPVNFCLVSNSRMLEFDHGFTDVLTFPKINENYLLGDVYMNIDFVRSQYMASMQLARIEELAVHSLLHLHDYTHDERREYDKMRNKEIQVLGRPCLPVWGKQILV
ncbi:hypothetical protein BASA81_003271 [Batrachochytrium salamandrivorans]|nr:hypothetical protein BASA81_003271 [Batrachochytrium salamandrivorans]